MAKNSVGKKNDGVKATISVNGGKHVDMDSPEAETQIGAALKRAHAAGIGHNSEETKDVENISGQRLKSYLDRIDRLEEEKKGLGDDIKDVYAEAKGVGFDTKTIRKLVRLRKMDTNKRHEEEELLRLYASAVGIQLDLGL